jgi:hypothetical protein
MKRILIVNKELDDNYINDIENNRRIIVKKNKTIIKDFNYFKNDFISRLNYENIDYNFFIEEWEVLNDKIQVVVSNDGSPMRPVHIKADLKPKDGAKALFQSEKMIIIKISHGLFEISKNIIGKNEQIESTIIKIGNYTTINDIMNDKSLDTFKDVFKAIIDKIGNYKEHYYAPIWAII